MFKLREPRCAAATSVLCLSTLSCLNHNTGARFVFPTAGLELPWCLVQSVVSYGSDVWTFGQDSAWKVLPYSLCIDSTVL